MNACCGLHRYLSDYLNSLPLGVLTRMVRTNDTLMALVPLLEEPPWVRKRNKKTEKFIGNVWTAVEPKERLRLTQHDAQASDRDSNSFGQQGSLGDTIDSSGSSYNTYD